MRNILLAILTGSLITNARSATSDFDLRIENAVQVSFQAETGKLYQIESSPEVTPPVWTTEGATILGTGVRHQTIFQSGPSSRRTYRIQEININAGLVGYYPFNGDANDASGSGNHATANGGSLSKNRFGEESRAYSFSQERQSIVTTNSVGFPVGMEDFTVSIWVNPTRPNEEDGHSILFSNFSADDFQLDLFWLAGSKVRIQFHTGGLTFQGPPDCESPELEWAVDRWYNVQMVRAGNTLRLYRDGLLQSESKTTQGNYAPAGLQRLEFGYRTPNAGNQLFGSVDDIRIYNRPLSLNELKALNDLKE